MKDLAKIDNQLATSDTQVSPLAIGKAITLMLGAGLKTYGQQPSVDAWATVLGARGVFDYEIEKATRHFLTREPEDGGTPSFPSASQFANWILGDREYQAMRVRMREFEEYERAKAVEALRLSNMEKYGTESPTREQVNERLKDLGLSDRMNALMEQGGEA
jgi:hypothetical protein